MRKGDFEKLTRDQQTSVNAWRKRVGQMIIAEGEAFEEAHPELRLTWNFTSEPLLCDLHPVIQEEL